MSTTSLESKVELFSIEEPSTEQRKEIDAIIKDTSFQSLMNGDEHILHKTKCKRIYKKGIQSIQKSLSGFTPNDKKKQKDTQKMINNFDFLLNATRFSPPRSITCDVSSIADLPDSKHASGKWLYNYVDTVSSTTDIEALLNIFPYLFKGLFIETMDEKPSDLYEKLEDTNHFDVVKDNEKDVSRFFLKKKKVGEKDDDEDKESDSLSTKEENIAKRYYYFILACVTKEPKFFTLYEDENGHNLMHKIIDSPLIKTAINRIRIFDFFQRLLNVKLNDKNNNLLAYALEKCNVEIVASILGSNTPEKLRKEKIGDNSLVYALAKAYFMSNRNEAFLGMMYYLEAHTLKGEENILTLLGADCLKYFKCKEGELLEKLPKAVRDNTDNIQRLLSSPSPLIERYGITFTEKEKRKSTTTPKEKKPKKEKETTAQVIAQESTTTLPERKKGTKKSMSVSASDIKCITSSIKDVDEEEVVDQDPDDNSD